MPRRKKILNTRKKEVTIVKKTVYINKELVKKIKLKAIMDDSTESAILDYILSEYFAQPSK